MRNKEEPNLNLGYDGIGFWFWEDRRGVMFIIKGYCIKFMICSIAIISQFAVD